MWLMHVCVSVRDPFQAYAILPIISRFFYLLPNERRCDEAVVELRHSIMI